MKEAPKQYLINGIPSDFREVAKKAQEAGYRSEDEMYYTSDCAEFLKSIGYQVSYNTNN